MPLWSPSLERISRSHLTAFTKQVEERHGRRFGGYQDLHRWSVTDAPAFWAELWDYCQVIGTRGDRLAVDLDRMPGAKFLPDAQLNFAQNLLRRRDAAPAIIATTEQGRDATLTFAELHHDVGRAAAALRQSGVQPGDRVAGIVANTAEAIVVALAAAALGAIWSGCSPDFGADGIVDRFGQIEPRVLISVDAYHYNGKRFDCLPVLREVVGRLPTVSQVVIVPLDRGRGADAPVPARLWDDWLADKRPAGVIEHAHVHAETGRLNLSSPHRTVGIAEHEAAHDVRTTGDGLEVHV
jgi:acetoacetyl-CoA synthetase